MIIVTEQAEQKLIEWLEKSVSFSSTPRAIHIPQFDGLYAGEDDAVAGHILDVFNQVLKDAECSILQTYDKDLLIVGTGILPKSYLMIEQYLKTKAAMPDGHSEFYEKGANWYQFSALCKTKQDDYVKAVKAQKLAAKKAKAEKARHAALNQPFSSELLASISKRRAERDKPEIVIVEDDPFSRKLVLTALADKHTVTPAVDGHNAISSYVYQAPDVMFLDIDLPDISGHEVLKKVLSIDPDAYIIMLSGNGDKENIMGAIQNGAKGFVAKPFTKDKLFAYIEKAPTC